MIRTVACLAALALAVPTLAQPAEPPPREVVIPLGNVLVNRTRQFVEVKGAVALERGLIELFACTPEGKLYESALVLHSRADMFQAGLLMLGLTRGTSGRHQGDEIKEAGSPVVILVRWTDPKTQEEKRYLAEDLVWDHRAAAPMKRVGWVFIGSRFRRNQQTQREVFMASMTGSLIVTYHDPDAILDTPHDAGIDDSTFYANHHILPARGTPVVLRVYPQKTYEALPENERAMARPLPPEPPKAPEPPGENKAPETPGENQ